MILLNCDLSTSILIFRLTILHVGEDLVLHFVHDLPLTLSFLYMVIEGGLFSGLVEFYLVVALRDNSKLPILWRHFFENWYFQAVLSESFCDPKISHAHSLFVTHALFFPSQLLNLIFDLVFDTTVLDEFLLVGFALTVWLINSYLWSEMRICTFFLFMLLFWCK